MRDVSVLFVNKNSVYKTLGVDSWDIERNALNFTGNNAVVAHPPCRLFCQLRHMSTAPPAEKELAFWAVKVVRRNGGVLEHPAMSTLWREANLPLPGSRDEHGLSIAVDQFWWGHQGRKSTWLYICGSEALPLIPFRFGFYSDIYAGGMRKGRAPKGSRGMLRSGTPIEFARWLIQTAQGCVTKPSSKVY